MATPQQVRVATFADLHQAWEEPLRFYGRRSVGYIVPFLLREALLFFRHLE